MREPGTTPVRQPLPPRAAMSKGSGRRPRFVPLHEYAANHERTFGTREPQPAPFGGKASVTVTDAHWDADGSLVVTGCRQVVTAPSPGSGDDAQS